MNKLIAPILLLFIAISARAQEIGTVEAFSDSFWVEEPTLTQLDKKDLEHDAIILKEYVIRRKKKGFGGNITISIEGGDLSNFLSMFSSTEKLVYRRIRLNNDAGVETFNRVYIPGKKSSISNIKARAINPDGSIVMFNDSNILEVENYEGMGPYSFFALEGIEVGAEIEVTYTKTYYGDQQFFTAYVDEQDYGYPIKDFHFEYICPEEYIFETKSYNGMIEVVQDTANNPDETNRYVLHINDYLGLKKEDYSPGNAFQPRTEFRLKENTKKDERNYFSWDDVAASYASKLYNVGDNKDFRKEAKAITKLIKKLKLTELPDDKARIIALEHWVKENIIYNGGGDVNYAWITLKYKEGTENSILRTMALVLTELDIDHQLVLTSNRYDKKFDGSFEDYTYLQEYLFYFPKYDQYLCPSYNGLNSRFGLIPFQYMNNDGLFLKKDTFGGAVSAYAEIKPIGAPAAQHSSSNLNIKLTIDDAFEKVNVHIKDEMAGYAADNIRPYLKDMKPEDKEELLEGIIKMVGEDATVSNITTQNETMEGNMMEIPFIIEADAELNSLIETAGKKYLFKIGQVIGQQSELYTEKERKTPIEIEFNHALNRTIELTIPDGYTVTNLDDLNIDVHVDQNGKRILEFISSYKLEGNKLVITISEVYDVLSLPIEMYEDFRSVINAAADFNKVTLVMEKA